MATAKPSMDKVFAQLLSADDQQVLDALVTVQAQGDARAIRPMLHALAGSEDEEVRRKVTAMLYQVKVPGAVPELLAALDEEALRNERRTILSAFWNAGLDVREHLEEFVSCAIEGDAAECLECLTVIENQEIWPEKAVRTSVLRVGKASEQEDDPYKAGLLAELREHLNERLGK